MSDIRQINEAVQRLSGTFMQDAVSLFIASVDSVDEDTKTCTVTPINTNTTTPYPEVMLSAENNDGILIVPAIDSTVIVAVSKRGVAYVCMYSDIDKITIITSAETKFISEATQFNDGSFGGLVKIQELVDKINRLENAFNTHVHSGVTAGSASTLQPSTPITPITMVLDLENKTITHGK